MDIKRIVIGTIVGAVALHASGYLIFDVLAADFYAANQGPATGAFRDFPMQGPLALANLAYAALLMLGLLGRDGAPTIGRGIVVSGIIGFLAWAHADLVHYAYMTTRPLPVVIVDPLLELVHAGLSGAVIVAVLSRVLATAAARAAS
jgi:hypothetical protein